MKTCAALLTIAAVTAAACGGRGPVDRERAASRPNVLLVTIDTFRADRLGAGVAPALDRLSASGIRFTSARAAVPLTLPSHTTILTGLPPPVHGVRENGVDALNESHPTIARLLKDAGYATAAFVGAFVLDRRYGLAQGFDTYDDRIPRDPRATERLEAERPASAVIDRALVWLEAAHPSPRTERAAPFFVWIHLYDPHAPYNPPPSLVRATSHPPQATDLYDGEIAYADSQIARVFEWLRSHQLADHTVVIVAGDHGEGLGDHGERTHGMLLYDSTLRVPLVVAAPGHPAAMRDEPVSLVDVAPTILRAAAVAPPDVMKGRDLLSDAAIRLRPDATYKIETNADLYAETEYPRVAGWSPLQALTDGRWMAIRSGAATELYDLRSDPQERHDLAAAQASTAAAMASRIDAIRARAAAPEATQRTAEREERLRLAPSDSSRGAASGGGAPRAPGNVVPAERDRGAGAPGVNNEAQDRLRALGYVASFARLAPASGAPNPAGKIDTWNRFEEALSALSDRKAEALPILAKLASENRDGPVFQTTYARALKEAGQIKAALTVYREAARRWPTDATLLHDLAVSAREAGNLDEARRADEAAVALAPTSAAAHNGAALIAIDQNRPRDAVREFDRATALDPNNAGYWTNLGNARRVLGDAAGAEQAYRRALDVDARSGDAANGLGVLLVEAHRPGEAVPWFERAVTAAPDLVEARLNLGIALQQSGQLDRAATAYRAVLASAGRHDREKRAATELLAAIGRTR